jgi:hypothetical protein
MDGWTSVPAAVLARLDAEGERTMVRYHDGVRFRGLPAAALAQRVRAAALALAGEGVMPGEAVGLDGPPDLDWLVADLALLCLGARPATAGVAPRHIVAWGEPPRAGALPLERLVHDGYDGLVHGDRDAIDARVAALAPETIAGGTTFAPITHGELVDAVKATPWPATADRGTVLTGPSRRRWRVRAVGVYAPLQRGLTVALGRGADRWLADAEAIEPRRLVVDAADGAALRAALALRAEDLPPKARQGWDDAEPTIGPEAAAAARGWLGGRVADVLRVDAPDAAWLDGLFGALDVPVRPV